MKESFDNDERENWLMEIECSGPAQIQFMADWSHTDEGVESAAIARATAAALGGEPQFVEGLGGGGDGVAFVGDEDKVIELKAEDIAVAQYLAETEGCGTMALASGGGTVGPGEFSGTGGIKGRPLTLEAQPMTDDHKNRELLRARYRTNPADPASGEAQGDAAASV